MSRNRIRYYATLREFFGDYKDLTYANMKTEVGIMSAGDDREIPFDTTFDNTFQGVWELLALRHANDYVTYLDQVVEEDEPASGEFDYSNFWRQFCNVYRSTQEKYVKLLTLYTAQQTHLMDELESTVESRFNDTPQNGGDWSNDQHTSTITSTTTSADPTTVMARLDEIANLYRDLVADWAEEFAPLFIQGGPDDYE